MSYFRLFGTIPNNYATYLSKNTIKMLSPLFYTFESRIIMNKILLVFERINLFPLATMTTNISSSRTLFKWFPGGAYVKHMGVGWRSEAMRHAALT
jgi:hypothetical protein